MTFRYDTRSRVSTYTKYWAYDGSSFIPVEYLVVAGGGGGGHFGGGGGARRGGWDRGVEWLGERRRAGGRGGRRA